MDKRVNNAVSASDSFFFQLIPRYFKVEHSFAKNIKPNTVYRLTLFKGIQKADEMVEPIKSKLVGGKIIFDKTILNFYLPLYSPARNIEFTLKILETKPNQQQTEIASHKIKSGDYIKQFRNDNVSYSKEEANLVDSFSLVFDLFVHSSKAELQKIVNDIQKTRNEGSSSLLEKRGSKTPRRNEISSEHLSQSDASDSNSINRNSGAFASKKKLMRKRGHDGKFKSKHTSRQGSEVSSSRSRSQSSRKSFGPFPHNEQNQHFVRSPKKVSPPKVEEHPNIQSQVKPTKRQNLVTVGLRQMESMNEKGPRNATPTKIGRSEINRERSQSVKKAQRANTLEINTPITDRMTNTNPRNNANAKTQLHELQIDTKQNLFDVKNKNQVPTPPNYRVERQRQSAPSVPSKGITAKSPYKPVQTKREDPQVTQQPEFAVEQPISKPTLEREKLKPTLQKQTQKSKGEIQGEQQDNFSNRQDRKISVVEIRQKPVVEEGERQRFERKMKTSVRLPTAPTLQPEAEQHIGKQFDSMKDKLFYLVFSIVSVILFWNAVTPSRKV